MPQESQAVHPANGATLTVVALGVKMFGGSGRNPRQYQSGAASAAPVWPGRGCRHWS